MKEQVNVPVAAEADTTAIDFGQAEPGRDVFGNKKDAKSEVRVAAKEPDEPPQVESEPVSSAVVESTVEKSADEPQPETVAVVEDEVVEGPPSEDDAEAERARSELFPNADGDA